MKQKQMKQKQMKQKQMKQKLYRAWINQPSTLQPLNHMHGVHCIVQDTGEDYVTLYFTEGDVHSTTAHRNCVSRIYLSKAEQ